MSHVLGAWSYDMSYLSPYLLSLVSFRVGDVCMTRASSEASMSLVLLLCLGGVATSSHAPNAPSGLLAGDEHALNSIIP